MDAKEAQLMAQFLQEKKGATPEEAGQFIKERYGVDVDSGFSFGKAARGTLDVAGRALDYAAGNVRNGLMQAADPFVDAELTKEGDTMQALKGNAPGSAEYLQRAGMDKGLANSGAGLALDIATDPLTYATFGVAPLLKGAGAAAKLSKAEKLSQTLRALSEAKGIGALDRGLAVAQNPLELMMPKAGKSLYKGAFAPTEAKIANEVSKTKTPISEVLMEQGFRGGPEDALKETRLLNRTANEEIGNTLKLAGNRGAKVNLGADDVFKRADSRVAELLTSNEPSVKALGKEMADLLAEYKAKGKLSAEEAYKLAKDIDSKTTSSAWKMMERGGNKDKVFVDMIQDLKGASRESVKAVDPDLHATLMQANEMFAATDRNVQKDLLREVKNASKRKGVSQIDAGLAAGAAASMVSGNPTPALILAGTLAGKKGAQAVTSMRGRTNLGTAMKSEPMKAINKYMSDPAVRQGILIDLLKQEEQ